jgi:hypothetical protein
MKILSLALILLIGAAGAQAHGPYRTGSWHGGGYYHGGCGGCWIAPAVIGGVIGYELTRPATVYVEPQPVIVQQPSVVYTQPQTVVQAPPAGYHWQEMIDPQTGITKVVAVPNQ